MKHFTIACFGFLIAGTLGAQEVSRFSFDVGGGFTQPVGNTGRHLDEGWNVRGGAGIQLFAIRRRDDPGRLQSIWN